MSQDLDTWHTLVNSFDHIVSITLGLLVKLLDSQGDTESIDASLQCMMHTYLDIKEDEQMLNRNVSVAATLNNLNNNLEGARARILRL
jgi:hypothetical protein